MPELDFEALRRRLEQSARQPDFSVIAGRRARRTRRLAMAGAAVVTALAVLTGVALGSAPHQPNPPVTTPTPTPSPSASPSPSPEVVAVPPPSIDSLTSWHANLYEVRTLGDRAHLRRSADLGQSWADLSVLSEPGQVVAANDQVMWLLAPTEIYATKDGAKTWDSWQVTNIDAYFVAGQRLWYADGGSLFTSDGGALPVKVAHAFPQGAMDFVVFGQSIIVRSVDEQDNPVWYRSDDDGVHWATMANPCATTKWPGDRHSTISAASDGSLWVVCSATAGAGQQAKDLTVSTDGGKTWKSRGALESNGYGTNVYPFSATLAWRTGDRADVYRTTDGTHWTDLVENGASTIRSFVAAGAMTAAYADEFGLHVTTDGGKTWVTRAV